MSLASLRRGSSAPSDSGRSNVLLFIGGLIDRWPGPSYDSTALLVSISGGRRQRVAGPSLIGMYDNNMMDHPFGSFPA
jgi:hypothetical protein